MLSRIRCLVVDLNPFYTDHLMKDTEMVDYGFAFICCVRRVHKPQFYYSRCLKKFFLIVNYHLLLLSGVLCREGCGLLLQDRGKVLGAWKQERSLVAPGV